MPPRARATTAKTKPTVRKPTATKKTTPRVTRAADNVVDAEATGAVVLMQWQGETFTIDLTEIQFGRATFALRQVANEYLPLMSRVNAMIDVVECALGQAQLARAYELSPRMFDDQDQMRAFWDAFNNAVNGDTAGKSSAS